MRHRSLAARAAVIALATALSVAATGCAAESEGAALSGRVVDETVAVAVPALPVVSPRTDAAVAGTAAGARSRVSTVAAITGLGTVARIAAIEVAVGDRVRAGAVVARLDDAALAADIEATRAAKRLADARVDALGARLDDVADARATIADNRADVRAAMADASATRADLVGRLAGAQAQLAALKALQARLASLPPGSTPPTGSLPPGLGSAAQLGAAIAQLETGIAQLQAAIAKVDAGLAKARSGLARLDDASATAADARAELEGVRDVARIAAEGATVAVTLAEVRRDLAVLRAPADGIVVAAVRSGETLAAGAPVLTIRPDAAPAVDVYVSPERAAGLAPGDTADVTTDSSRGRSFSARVSWIAPRATYPPTWLATTDVHMTRAHLVRVTLVDHDARLAPGTPAEVRLGSRTSE